MRSIRVSTKDNSRRASSAYIGMCKDTCIGMCQHTHIDMCIDACMHRHVYVYESEKETKLRGGVCSDVVAHFKLRPGGDAARMRARLEELAAR